MEAFAAAVNSEALVYLVDPNLSASARAEFEALIAGSSRPDRARDSAQSLGDSQGWLRIATGGSGGRLKFACHDEATLRAAAGGFLEHFGFGRVQAIGVLPMHHVSGLMPWIRCAVSGGDFTPCSWKALESGFRPEVGPGEWVVSLVPTQLQRLVSDADSVDWLRRFRTVFVGGAPLWPALAERAAELGLRLSTGYGMSETAAMVTGLLPEEFLGGERGCGAALPHARIEIGADGRISVSGESLFRGYAGGARHSGSFETADLGSVDSRGHLTVLGRSDGMIVTGGEKVDPFLVESALQAAGIFTDVVVVGLDHGEWGQELVACHPDPDARPDPARLKKALEALAPHERPKRYIAVHPWPRTSQGKIDRLRLAKEAAAGQESAFTQGKK